MTEMTLSVNHGDGRIEPISTKSYMSQIGLFGDQLTVKSVPLLTSRVFLISP